MSAGAPHFPTCIVYSPCARERHATPRQQVQASLCTGAGRFGLSSAEVRGMSTFTGSLMATVSEVFFFDLSDTLEQNVRGGLPCSDLVHRVRGGGFRYS